jgi:hypothetical protein
MEGCEIFSFSKLFIPAVEPIQCSIQLGTGESSAVGKGGLGGKLTTSFIAEIRNEWSCTAAP